MDNKPIAAIIKDGLVLHEDYEPIPGCTMGDLTYGEVCIKCNVCGRFKDRPVPTEEAVRGLPEKPEEGWGFDADHKEMHYFERLTSAARCGYNGVRGELWSTPHVEGNIFATLCQACRDITEASRR